MHLKSRSIAAIIIGSLAFGSATVAPVQAKTPTVKSLKRKLAKVKKSRTAWVKRERAARATVAQRDATIGQLGGQIGGLKGQIGTLNGQVAALVAANNAYGSDLSQSIRGIAAAGNSEQLRIRVLDPAYEAWTCGGTRDSYSFQLGYTFNIGIEYSPCTGTH